jgi:hypothetical protein
MAFRNVLLVLVAGLIAWSCGDDHGEQVSGNPPEGMLGEGGLTPGLLTLEDLGSGWTEPTIDPPHGSASHFVCMPLYFDGAFDTGVSIEFSGPVENPDFQAPDLSQRLVRYPDADAAMNLSSAALGFCLDRSALGSFGEPDVSSLEGVGDENLLTELTGELEGMIADASGEQTISEEVDWRAIFIRRDDLITLLMAIGVTAADFERLARIADERLQELD